MAGRCAERCVCEGSQLLAFLVPFWSEVPLFNQIGHHSCPLCGHLLACIAHSASTNLHPSKIH